MKQILKDLNKTIFYGSELYGDVVKTLNHHNLKRILHHTIRVVMRSEELAKEFNCDVESAKKAALLHDISGIIDNDKRLEVCHQLGIPVCDEEKTLPLITHQKLSESIARVCYGIRDKEILSAIKCHTTLKRNPSQLDLIVFIADKLDWDQEGIPPYYDQMMAALEDSLEASALVYIRKMKPNMVVKHPWLLEAQSYLENILKLKYEDKRS